MKDLMTFKFEGGPIDSPDKATAAFASLGKAAAAWARLEQQIDAILMHVNKAEFSKELFDPEHPVSFKRKLRLMKAWFNKHPALAPYKDDVQTLISKAKVLAPHRNTYLHSIFEGYDAGTDVLTFRSLKYQGNSDFKVTRTRAKREAVEALAELSTKSNRFLWRAVSRRLFTDDAVRRLRMP